MEQDEHLTSLLVDQSLLDTKLLAESLRDRVGIDTHTGDVAIGPSFNELNNEQRVTAVLLGRLAANLLGRRDSSAATLKEVADLSGMPSGSVAPAARALATKRRLALQDDEKRYYIPRPKVMDACRFLAPERKPQ